MHDSNPGRISASAGGVTRNVCENLARLGADVRLITAVGDDLYADMIRRECVAAGIDVPHRAVPPPHTCPFWTAAATCWSRFPT